VAEVHERGVVLADGATLPSDLTVLTTAFEVPALARASGLPVAGSGALRVDESLVCAAAPGVVGAGDATLVGARGLRMSCQAAVPMGAHAAETVLALAGGTVPRPVRTRFTGRCISLGRRATLWQRSNAADVPTSFTLTGRPGAQLKEQICASTIGSPSTPGAGGCPTAGPEP
jgi:NADH dehydrogenase FAD-containing subunit